MFVVFVFYFFFFFQAEDGIRDFFLSRGLGDGCRRRGEIQGRYRGDTGEIQGRYRGVTGEMQGKYRGLTRLVYTSDAADELHCVRRDGARNIKKKNIEV